ncbi:MAG: hypothetical protein AAF266_11205 [Planctomycetota bacterium]
MTAILAVSTLLAAFSGVTATADETSSSVDAAASKAGYSFVGTLGARHARDIEGSVWSIGAETMDRDFTVYENWRGYLGPLGAKKARIQSGWAKTETKRGEYQWGWMDRIVRDMVDQGVEPWACLCYGNPIYPGGGGIGLGEGFLTSEEALDAWLRYVAAFVDRYGDVIDGWELWNEPREDRGAPPHAYAEFVRRTALVIRKEQPGAQVYFAAGGSFDERYARAVLDYLKQRRALHLVDRVIYHPYAYNPDSKDGEVASLRQLVKSYASHLGVMQGENGAPSKRGGFGAINRDHPWSEENQTKWALRRLLGDFGSGIPSSYFTICDIAYPSRVNYKGLLSITPDKRVSGVKQAYGTLQRLFSLFDNRLQPTDSAVKIRNYANRFRAFSSLSGGTYPVVAMWRSDEAPGINSDFESIDLSVPKHRFGEPVWIDLLTGKVFAVDGDSWKRKGRETVFQKVPVYDSPILVAELAGIGHAMTADDE